MSKFFSIQQLVPASMAFCLGLLLALGCKGPSSEVDKAIQRAEIYMRTGRFAKALAEYEQVLAAKPDHYEARLGAGKCYLAKRELEEARKAFEHSAQLRPEEADPWIGLAQLVLAEETPDLPSAVNYSAQAINRQPDRMDSRILLGTIYRRQGKRAEAVDVFRGAIRLDPKNTGLRVLLAQSLIDLGNITEAEEVLKEPLQEELPRSVPLKTALAQLWEFEGRIDEALALLVDLKEDGIPPSTRYQRGRLCLLAARDPQRDPAERESLRQRARADGEVLLGVDPQDLAGLELKGIALFDQGQYDDALLVLQEIRSLLDRRVNIPEEYPSLMRRRVAMLLLHLGRCHMETFLPRKGGEVFIRASRWDRDAVDVYFWSAITQLQIGDRQGAALALDKMVERLGVTGFQRDWSLGRELYPPLEDRFLKMLETWAEEDPVPISPLLGLAQLNLRLGKPEECIAWCAQASERAPNRAEPHYLRSAALFQQEEYSEGLEALRTAKRMDPTFLPAYLRLARIYQGGRRPDLAIREYRSALEQREQDRSELLRGLARAYAALGDDARAIESLTQVLEEEPDDLETLRVLTAVYVRRGRAADPVAYDKMVSLCDRILHRAPKNEWALMIKAEALIRKGELEKAEVVLRTLCESVPTSVIRTSAYASVLALRGEFARALEVADAAQKVAGATAELGIIRGLTHILQEDPDQAIQTLSAPHLAQEAPNISKTLRAYAHLLRGRQGEALQLLESLSDHGQEERKFCEDFFGDSSPPSPDDIKTLARLVFLAYRGWWTLASQEASELARRSDDKAQPLWWQAEAARRLNRVGETYRLLGELVEQAPYSGRGWMALATIEAATDPAKAIQFYRKALPLFAGDVNWLSEIHFRIGMLSEQTGAESAAIQEYRLALEQDPNHGLAANNLAVLLMDQNLEEAKQLALRAVEAHPSRGEIRDTYGWICFRMGDLETALSELRVAASLAPYHPSIRYHAARAFQEAGEIPRVRGELEMALAIGADFPEREEAEKLLGELPPAQE